ncbi:adenine phosphoribosyltransferase [Echinococcus multilocularis]|uniref:Adenine phosphoribosyltransferase n=1 Tax=Echinococcus multilocularis TaxID=6211 RepID=A0A087VXC3_ECHMU|nr:adenine phosphoribosyltransferase [Echinococcus multilocularis]
MSDQRVERVRRLIKAYPDFPKKGINFLDIFPIFRDQTAISDCVTLMAEEIKKRFTPNGETIDAIIGLESRGFIFGILLSTFLKVPFVPIRKAGKLPGECIKGTYDLEYGSAAFELQKSALNTGSRVVLIDDVLAIGGTMSAAAKLCKEASLNVLGAGMLLEVANCEGGQRLDELGLKWFSILKMD